MGSSESSGRPGIRIGCVDAGSNAIRFLVAEFPDANTQIALHERRLPIRLGHEVFLSGRLTEDAIRVTVRAFADFRRTLDALQVRHFRAVATSAVRCAENSGDLIDRIARDAEIQLEVISPHEEARLVHSAVAHRVELAQGDWVLADLGGGSLEISLANAERVLWTESHKIGSVRLLEVLSGAEDEPHHFAEVLEAHLDEVRMPPSLKGLSPAGLVATGGNIEAVARLASAPVDASGVQRLSTDALSATISRLANLTYPERIEQLGLQPDRADVVLPAAIVYQRVATLAGVEQVVVPNTGVKDGIVWDILRATTT